ncbi:hypothetical protein R3W88_016586 [Solanum pinnatisectum]|uniref:Uncharacterized protein n=1 Tax=Solanum pinnatisectum TaxID=50273 RepID=A0AAV9KYJ9_9SOLN|nr:hypothetical protein R3W88_016586 [Solanum pinnatisectum]
MQQSVSLLQVKDLLIKRMGASRLARFATDDEKRMKIVEIGGAQQLLNMLESARDDRTRKESLKALFAISKSGQDSNLSTICVMLYSWMLKPVFCWIWE